MTINKFICNHQLTKTLKKLKLFVTVDSINLSIHINFRDLDKKPQDLHFCKIFQNYY
jgi:hypothetical protein